MEVQRVTGHKTFAMLLRHTQVDVGRIVEGFDESEESMRPSGDAKHSTMLGVREVH